MSKERDEETVKLMHRIVDRSVELAICDMPVMHNEWSRLGKDHKEEIVTCVVYMGVEPLEDLVAQRDALRAELEEFREAARELVGALTSNGGGRSCGNCYALATVAEPLPRGGSAYRCDRHASPPMTEQEREFDRTYGDDLGDGRPTIAAAPLRTLRKLLEGGKP